MVSVARKLSVAERKRRSSKHNVLVVLRAVASGHADKLRCRARPLLLFWSRRPLGAPVKTMPVVLPLLEEGLTPLLLQWVCL